MIQDDRGNSDDDDNKMPLLVYVSRERRPSYPHRFKAGALNALVRSELQCACSQIYRL